MTMHAIERERRRKADAARQDAEEAERRERREHSQRLGAERAAEKARQAAEAKAEADREYAARYAAMTPIEREVEDHVREVASRWEAEKAAEAANPPARPNARTRPMDMTLPVYVPPPPVDSSADGLDAHARALEARAEAEPTEGNRCQAAIAAAEAARARAIERFEAERRAADLAVADRERAAGPDPVARARARAEAVGQHATRLGEAEAAVQAAELARDKTIVEVAAAAKLAGWRIESRKAQLRADEARAANDPHALGNPYWKPPVSLARWQVDALPPEAQAQAVRDGVRIYDDAPPPFTAADAKGLLRLKGSPNRPVLTRAEFDSLSPAGQAKAAREAIVVDG